jgi:iron complex outermembrane receptor protein
MKGCNVRSVLSVILSTSALAVPHMALAQAAPDQASTSEAATGQKAAPSTADIADIIVTATKRAGGVSVQNAPLAVTAFNEKLIGDLHITQISDFANSLPNVFMSSNASTPRTAGFFIRGMGVNTTNASVTPAVGVFVDGVYLGLNQGTVLDAFDLEGVEVLRGPQGLLFGRNVTAGAVLLRTTTPTDTLKIDAKASVDGGLNGNGLNYTGSVLVSGPLNEAGTLRGKIAVFNNHDQGYFFNHFNNNDRDGKSSTTLIRGALAYDPSDTTTNVLRVEHGSVSGDGVVVYSPGIALGRKFYISNNNQGYNNYDWTMVANETNINVALGDGVITNIAGYRSITSASGVDSDGSPTTFGHGRILVHQHQLSDELRYSGTFGRVKPTVGVFYYKDRIAQVEDFILASGAVLPAGGIVKSRQYAIFGAFDIDLPYDLVLTLGARYSKERKIAAVQQRGLVPASPCSVDLGGCSSYGFHGAHSWSFFTPKVGLAWTPSNNTNIYGYWTRANRSGGYNLRQSNAASPGPYGQEKTTTYEVGLKQQLFDRRVSLNLAAFHTKLANLQRDINLPTVFGVTALTVNVGTIVLKGVEGEATVKLLPGLTLSGNVGYIDNKFTKIGFDLSNNGSIGPEDFARKLPYASKWSYGISLAYNQDTSFGSVGLRTSFNHRDRAFSNDANTSFIVPVNNLDASLALTSGRTTLSIYGKNLQNKLNFGLNSPQAYYPNAAFIPLNKGRVVGVQLEFSY